MLRAYASECYELDEQIDLYERTEAQVRKLALADALHKMADLIRGEAYRGEVDMPKMIHVAVEKRNMDLQVVLTPDRSGK